MRIRPIRLLCLVAIALAHGELASAGAMYHLTDLGSTSSTWYRSFASLNDSGQLLGLSLREANSSKGYLYSSYGPQAGLRELPANVLPMVMNNSGVIATSRPSGDTPNISTYSNGAWTDFGTVPGSIYLAPSGINSSGQVVAISTSPDASTRIAVTEGGVLRDIGNPEGYSAGYPGGINASGQVVGTWRSADWQDTRGFLYTAGKFQDLGTPPGLSSSATAINDAGQVVGSLRTESGVYHAFLSYGGQMHDLGTLAGGSNSGASDINEAGVAVGYSETGNLSASHAVLFGDGEVLDLNDLISPESGWLLERAFDINGLGQILGYGTDPLGRSGQFLLTPSHLPIPAPVPEPLTLAAFTAIAAISVRRSAARRWKSRGER